MEDFQRNSVEKAPFFFPPLLLLLILLLLLDPSFDSFFLFSAFFFFDLICSFVSDSWIVWVAISRELGWVLNELASLGFQLRDHEMERWWLDLIGWLVCPGHQPEIGWVDKMSWGGQLKKGKLKKKKKKSQKTEEDISAGDCQIRRLINWQEMSYETGVLCQRRLWTVAAYRS